MEQNKINHDIFIECPHCQVCSTKLSAEEYALVEEGQQMMEVCQVCGSDIVINDCRALT